MAKTTMIKVGIWEVPDISKMYNYRVCTSGKGWDWSLFRITKSPDDPKWKCVETGFKSKASAVEYVEELAAREYLNPVADLLNNIDDGVDLNEGR